MAVASSIPQVLQEVALLLTRPVAAGQSSMAPARPLGMATLVAPRLAIVPMEVTASVELLLASQIQNGEPVGARLLEVLIDLGLVLLELDSDLPMPAAEPALLRVAELHPRSEWYSAFATPVEPGGVWLSHGTLGSDELFGDRRRLTLHPSEGAERTMGIAGAPVISGESVVGILVEAPPDGPWHAVPLSPDLVHGLRQRQRRTGSRTAPEQAVQREFAPEAFFARLSPSSLRAIGHADGMRRRSNQDRIHMEHLVVGLFLKQDGPAERLFREARINDYRALKELLSKAVETELPEGDDYTPTSSTALPKRSAHVEAAFRAAQAIADDRRSSQIQSRHLLYGALTVGECSVIELLHKRGIRKEGIPLGDAPAPESPLTPIIGAASDRPGGEDLLSLATEIDALSALVASRETRTPLSIGLFGDWGSGKSFFMQKMDERIREFRDAARAAPDGSSPFCPNIVQLWFNAWHYIDQSLWASLGAEIFEGLAHSLAQEEASKRDRKELEDARTRLLAQRAALEDQHRAAQQAALESGAAVQVQVEAIRSIETRSDREIERSLGTKATAEELLGIIASQPEIKAQLDGVARRIGLPELRTASDDARGQVEALVGIASYWKSALTVARSRASAKWWIVGAVLAGAVLVAGADLLEAALDLQGAVNAITTGITAVVGLLAPVLAVARRATAVMRGANARMRRRIDDARQAALAAAEARRRDAEAKAEADRRRLSDLQQQLQTIDQQLEQLRPARQLTDFIRRRHASDEYTKHFGVIARARLDFEELTRLMELVREQPELALGGSGDEQFPPLDRIVLYIDDLDRCREDKVFEVLQAVHLLLAFPLFIVVVGVDPRWLLHSLRHQLGAFRDQPDEEVEGDEGRIHWRSTPLNYLEKIFQIPFTVRPMEEGGYGRLIDELTDPEKQPAQRTPPPQSPSDGQVPAPAPSQLPPVATGGPSTVGGAAAGTDQPLTPAQPPDQPAAELEQRARLAHERLQLEHWEREYLKRLFPLIPTPRATKRLVNVYRLLRAITTGEQRQSLLGDERHGGYRAVLLLLAMVTAFPAEATAIIRELLEGQESASPPDDWWAFVADFRAVVDRTVPRQKPARQQKVAPKKPARQPDRSGLEERDEDGADRWGQFFEKLQRIRGETEDDFSCSEMALWAPVVARYSFASGRLLLERD